MIGESFLSSEAKWELLRLLAEKPRSPKELAEITHTTIANISQQLRLLETAGIIVGERKRGEGKGKPQTVYKLKEAIAMIAAVTPIYAEKGIIHPSDFEIAILRLLLIPTMKKDILLEKLIGLYRYIDKIEVIAYKNDELLVKANTTLNIKGVKQIRKPHELSNSIILYTPI